MKYAYASVGLMLVVCVCGFLYSSGLVKLPDNRPLPLPPIPPPQWHVIAGYFNGDRLTIYQPDKDFYREMDCFFAAAKINKTLLLVDQIGVATCRQ